MKYKLVGKILKIFLSIWCLKNKLWKTTNSKKHISMLFHFEMVKQLPIWNCPIYDLQLMKSKIVLPKPNMMNDCHYNYFNICNMSMKKNVNLLFYIHLGRGKKWES
jgi:hypothetical protein